MRSFVELERVSCTYLQDSRITEAACFSVSIGMFSAGRSLTLSFAVRQRTPFSMHLATTSEAGFVVLSPIMKPMPLTLSMPGALADISGDANNDGELDLKDIEAIVRYIMTGDIKGFNFKNADMNGDTEVNTADLVLLINEVHEMK